MKYSKILSRLLFIGTLVFSFITACKRDSQRAEALPDIPDSLTISRIDTFPVESSIRALEVVDDNTVWFAGSGGVFGFTENGGESWTIDSIKTDTIVPHFRAIAVTSEAVFLLSIASPALLYRSVDDGKNWEIVYREDHPAAFYDAMVFWDEQEGIAMGDPTDECLSVIITRDGGQNWQKIDCSDLPPAEEGEAAFAASNSNISVFKDNVWIVSGGAKARVFHAADRGNSWQVYDTPIVAGGEMTGIFTSHFWDENDGIIFGGNWEKMEQQTKNKALTKDGGRSWYLVGEGYHPGYRSAVRYAPDGAGNILLATGIPGTSWSKDGGNSWKPLDDAPFYTLRFGSSYRTVWLAGNRKIGKIVWEQ
jgi:photosystem II stability/assembly factor-like uncharacterized protein